MLKLSNSYRSKAAYWCASANFVCPEISTAHHVEVTPQEMRDELSDRPLYKFALEVASAFSYGVMSFYRNTIEAPHPVLYVRYGTDPYASGFLRYGDNNITVRGDNTYAVVSPFVKNGKYRPGTSEHHMSYSESLPRAVKSSKTFLRRIPQDMVATRMFRENIKQFLTFHQEYKAAYHTKCRDLFGGYSGFDPNIPLHSHLLHCVDSGYGFVDAKFGADLKAAAKEYREIKIMENKNDDEWFIVFVRDNSAGKPEVIITKILVSGPPDSWGRSFSTDEYAYVADPEEVPDTLQGTIALLQMVDDGHYVEGVGVRLTDGSYFARAEKGAVVLE